MSIQKEIIENYIKKNVITFEQIDKIFFNLPKVLTKIIYDYAKPYCDDCFNCCSLCLFYCSMLECLRENRDNKICCQGEMNQEIRKYSLIIVDVLIGDLSVPAHLPAHPDGENNNNNNNDA